MVGVSFDMSVAVGGAAPVEPLPAERARGRGVFHSFWPCGLAHCPFFHPFFIDVWVYFLDVWGVFIDIEFGFSLHISDFFRNFAV